MKRYRVSVDVGGTFTDVIASDTGTGQVIAGKTSTTPLDLTLGILGAIDQVVRPADVIDFLVHGTTQGLNAFIQRRGERVLLLATQGAGDVYHIARGNRSRLYDIHFRKPEPLVPRRDIVEVTGRLDYRGKERVSLDTGAVRRAAARVRQDGFGAVAVAFLFSYVNPEHELEAARVLRAELGEDFPVTLSHQVAREWREYERTASTVLDAYIAPTVRRYLTQLGTRLADRGVSASLHVMQSNGGIITAAAARQRCLQTLLSGPVGGTMGGASIASQLHSPNLICIDMGGTSFDVSLIVDGQPDVDVEASLEGFPILMPVVRIHTIGAGGGSVAYVEAGGLRVGPRSAGAEPGPACYGRGGSEPTVTDANLVLGRVDPDWFAGGAVSLDVQAARGAVKRLADELHLGAVELAEGACAVINTKMAQAIRAITVEKGLEPRDYALLAYGGAGPMHACFLADELEIGRVIVPPDPGAFSAWGMLETDLRQDFATAMFVPLDRLEPAELRSRLKAMAEEGTSALTAQGVPSAAIRHDYAVDMRYRGQEYNLTVPLDPEEAEAGDFRERLAGHFHVAYQRRFGHSNPGAPVEIVIIRTAVVGAVARRTLARRELAAVAPPGRQIEMIFDGRPVAADAFDRRDVSPGASLIGPALVVEQTATTVLPPGWRLQVDELGFLHLTKHQAGK